MGKFSIEYGLLFLFSVFIVNLKKTKLTTCLFPKRAKGSRKQD